MFDNLKKSQTFKKAMLKLEKWDKVVYCDIDWTIYRDSLFLDVVDFLIKDWFISKTKSQKYQTLKKQWKNREINYEDFLMYTVLEIYEKVLHKIPYNYLVNIAPKIIKNKGKRVFLYTLNKLRELQSQWYKIIFISGSPLVLVHAFAKKYWFDIWLWSYSSKDNRWNLKREFVLASNTAKMEVIEYINNLIKPSHIISFGDTTWDFSMLANADIWYAVNPTAWLYSKIKDIENIIVVVERKDLVLEMNSNVRKYINYLSLN